MSKIWGAFFWKKKRLRQRAQKLRACKNMGAIFLRKKSACGNVPRSSGLVKVGTKFLKIFFTHKICDQFPAHIVHPIFPLFEIMSEIWDQASNCRPCRPCRHAKHSGPNSWKYFSPMYPLAEDMSKNLGPNFWKYFLTHIFWSNSWNYFAPMHPLAEDMSKNLGPHS